MIKLEDIKFETKFVCDEETGKGKTGCDMVAWYILPDRVNECVYASHDFEHETLTEDFKQKALENINRMVSKYENKPTTKIKRWWRKWVVIPKHRIIS